jgi:membrane-associated protein
MDSNTFYDLIGSYGIFAVFFLAMIEGDMTLLLAGVLAHSGFFGDYSFLKVLCFGTLGGVAGDSISYCAGRTFGKSIRGFRFFRAAKPRIEKLTEKFGPLSIFLSKYIYGVRTAICIFWGVGRMRYLRFLPLAFGSCLVWVSVLSGAGYFFSGAVISSIGDFHHLGILLLVIVVVGVTGLYLAERLWFSKKIEHVDPDLIQELEQAAQEKLHEIGERIHLKSHTSSSKIERGRKAGVSKRSGSEGD